MVDGGRSAFRESTKDAWFPYVAQENVIRGFLGYRGAHIDDACNYTAGVCHAVLAEGRMARTPNDDRSDTKNPNNAAYAADQENRYGSDDDYGGSGGASPAPAPRPPPNALLGLADKDLGPPPKRFPGLRTLDELRWEFELTFATPESEARDRRAGCSEVLRMAAKILEVARDALVRQGRPAELNLTEERVELRSGDRGVAVVGLPGDGIVHMELSGRRGSGYVLDGRRWRSIDFRESRYGEPGGWYRDSSRPEDPLKDLVYWIKKELTAR